MGSLPDVSVVIPVHDEEENVQALYEEINTALMSMNIAHEIIFVEDGSKDGTYKKLMNIKNSDDKVKVLRFQKNFGKAAALSCGFANATSKNVITMDGDLQDDPAEIPRFVEALKTYDVVSGWKYFRHDPLTKIIPSKVFNWATGVLTGLKIHDFNCGYKAYRREVVKNLNIYGEMHRYIPALAFWKGYNVGELKVRHRPRIHGKSKYGVKRLFKGTLDLLTVKFLISYQQRPLHLFGGIGVFTVGVGFAICSYLLYLWLNGMKIGERPLLILGILLVIIGIQFFAIGLIGELMISYRDNNEWIVREED